MAKNGFVSSNNINNKEIPLKKGLKLQFLNSANGPLKGLQLETKLSWFEVALIKKMFAIYLQKGLLI